MCGAGKARLLATSAPSPQGGDLKGVPHWRGLGVDLHILHWRGLFAPPGTPPDVVAFWDERLARLMKTEGWKKMLAQYGWADAFADSAQFRRELIAEREVAAGCCANWALQNERLLAHCCGAAGSCRNRSAATIDLILPMPMLLTIPRTAPVKRRNPLRHITALLAALGVTCGAAAQHDYPNRPVRLVSGYAAGGTTSLVGRMIGQKLSESWGHQFILDNRPAAVRSSAARSWRGRRPTATH